MTETGRLAAAPGTLRRLTPDGGSEVVVRPIIGETPIAIEVNGIGYAVLMASDADLVDLAYGFFHAERLIRRREDVVDMDVHRSASGTILRVTLIADCVEAALQRVRHRVSESACGLCGIENLEQALRPLPRVTQNSQAEISAVFHALSALPAMQPLGLETGAAHAAALCDRNGAIRLVREDVGRHNAFDKLIGAMLRSSAHWDGGFALLSSRCSYELVEKAVLADCPLLVTISAPTTLAMERAREAGLSLMVLARPDAVLVCTEGQMG